MTDSASAVDTTLTTATATVAPLTDPFGRRITYLRLSLTDRCDFRCVYCMDPRPRFLPRQEILSLEEMERLCRAFIRAGVSKIRLTGGEPLVRREAMTLIRALGSLVQAGSLQELALTTNGSRLAAFATDLAAAGLQRINVSLDTLQPARFAALTRGADLDRVLAGIEAARAAGLRIKINTVALRGINEDELDTLVAWCGDRGFDLTFIELMPFGEQAFDLSALAAFPLSTSASASASASSSSPASAAAAHRDSTDSAWPLSAVRERLQQRWTLEPSDFSSGGPARYWRCRETGTRLGFISPLSQCFCDGCNRVRLTCSGRLYLCLGQEDSVDLRQVLRSPEGCCSDADLDRALGEAVARKPAGHEFTQSPPPPRPMSLTGG